MSRKLSRVTGISNRATWRMQSGSLSGISEFFPQSHQIGAGSANQRVKMAAIGERQSAMARWTQIARSFDIYILQDPPPWLGYASANFRCGKWTMQVINRRRHLGSPA